MHDFLSKVTQTNLLPPLPNRTAGTATASTFVSAGNHEYHVFQLNLGTANDAGSVTAFRVLQGTAATPGASTKLVTGATLTSFTNGGSVYGIEIKSDVLDSANGFTFIGCEVVVSTAGTATYTAQLIQHGYRNAPPTSTGFAGTVQVLT